MLCRPAGPSASVGMSWDPDKFAARGEGRHRALQVDVNAEDKRGFALPLGNLRREPAGNQRLAGVAVRSCGPALASFDEGTGHAVAFSPAS